MTQLVQYSLISTDMYVVLEGYNTFDKPKSERIGYPGMNAPYIQETQ